MKKRKVKAAAKKQKTKAKNGRRKAASQYPTYSVHRTGRNFEIRSVSGKKTYGPYSTREAADEAAGLLNRIEPKSRLLE